MFRNHAWAGALALLCTALTAPGSARAEDDERPAPITAAQYAADMSTPAVLTVSPEDHHDTLPSLRNTPVPPSHAAGVNFEGMLPLPPGLDNQTDGAVQSATRAPQPATPATLSSFDGNGLGFVGPQGTFQNRWVPPDTNGAIGSTQYVQTVNDQMAVFDKQTNTVLYGPVPENILWVGFGGGCEANNDGDPVVVYDKAADRWVVSQFSITNSNTYGFLQCVAVSKTNDATGAWNRYAFTYTQFPDYPKMGVWPDAYYETFNMFKAHGGKFVGANLCAYDRTAMLAGNAATQQCFQLASSFGGVLPSDLDGATPPPAGSPNFLVNFGTNALNLWKFHVDWANTANTTLTGPTSIAVATFSPACGGGTCIPQSGSTQQLDSLADRLMFRLAYRNFGASESLVVSHSVTAGAGSGVRWYEIRSPNATPTVFQQSTYAPDNTLYRWMPSIAMDHDGNMALGYSTSGSAAFPSVVYTARQAGDPVSTMGSEVTMAAGGGAQGGAARWGDYSAMTIDPSDDCTFWYTNEYVTAAANGTKNWSTRIGSFKFPTCNAGAANKLEFKVEPNASYASGATIMVKVFVEDSTGRLVTSDTSAVTLALSGGTAGAILSGTNPVNAVGGIATFNLSVDKAGTNYVLNATDTGLTGAASTAFNITAGKPTNIAFTTQPSNAVAGANITPAIVVHVSDAAGNAVSNDLVTLTIANNPGGSTLTGGGATATNASGDVTFSGVSLNKVGTGYTLTASDGSATPITTTSNAFNITAGAATTVTFTTQPAAGQNITAGTAIPLVAHVTDTGGNPIANESVQLALGNNPGGSTLSVTTNPVTTDANGNAPFSGVSLDKSGNGYTFTATDTTTASATRATSNAFNIVAAAASQLAFSTQPPASSQAGAAFGTAVTVQDQFGNTVTSDTSNVTVALTTPNGATLSGTTTVAAASGVATFSGLSVNKVGSYTLTATDGSLKFATSNSFTITPGAAAGLVFTVDASNTTAGTAMSPAVKVSLVDAFGNLESADNTHTVTLTLSAGSDPSFSGGGPITLVNGVATFPAITLTKAATGYQLGATTNAGAFTANSASFNVSAAVADHLSYTPAPASSIMQGQTLGSVTVTEYDTYNNQVTSDNGTRVTLTAGSCGGTQVALTQALTGGAVTFNTTQVFKTVANNVSLTAAATATPPTAAATTFNVTANSDFVFFNGFETCTP